MTLLKNKRLFLAAFILVGTTGMSCAEAGNANNNAAVFAGEWKTDSIVHTADGECVRTKWKAKNDLCRLKPIVASQKVIKTRLVKTFSNDEKTVYFVFNSAFLTDEGKTRLNTLASALKTDQNVKEAKIIGFADRIGSNAYNEQLSQKRAETVRDYLINNGYTNARVTDTRWVGEEVPLTNCAATGKRTHLIECLQRDRRVEVEIDYLHEEKIVKAQ